MRIFGFAQHEIEHDVVRVCGSEKAWEVLQAYAFHARYPVYDCVQIPICYIAHVCTLENDGNISTKVMSYIHESNVRNLKLRFIVVHILLIIVIFPNKGNIMLYLNMQRVF